MRRTFTGCALVACLTLTAAAVAAQRKPDAKPAAATQAKPKPTPKSAADADALKAELDEIVKLDAATRVERLSAFVKANPDTPQTLRARELLVSARAALGEIGRASCRGRV